MSAAVMKMTLTKIQTKKVESMFLRLVTWIHMENVTIDLPASGEILQGQGYYVRDERRIVLGDVAIVKSFGIPIGLGRLILLSHEFGHHLSHNGHEKHVGREPDSNQAFDVLYEESSAWNYAAEVLNKLGMRGKKFWAAFSIIEGRAISDNAHGAAAHWWLREQIRRFEIKCPCGSDDLVTLGSSLDSAVGCAKCGDHTKHCDNVYEIPDTSFDLERKLLKNFCCECERREKSSIGKADWTIHGQMHVNGVLGEEERGTT